MAEIGGEGWGLGVWGLWGGLGVGQTGIPGGRDEGGNSGMGWNCNVLARKIINVTGDSILACQSYRPGHHMCLICLHSGPNNFTLYPSQDLNLGGNVCQTHHLRVSGNGGSVTGSQRKLSVEGKPVLPKLISALCSCRNGIKS